MKWLLTYLGGQGFLSDPRKYLAVYRVAAVVATLICLLPIPLERLLRLFGSDKQKPGEHAYGPTYHALFRPWKYRRLKLLEIGIGGYHRSLGGNSLLAWQAFFPFGRIHGADIHEKAALAGRRRVIIRLDQSSPSQLADLAAALGGLDIIIDDGSHMNAHQILTFECLFGALKDGGVYVIEDVQTSFWPGIVAGVAWDGRNIHDVEFPRTCHGYFLELSKYLNQAEFVDRSGMNDRMAAQALSVRRITFEHNLIVIHKGANREPSNYAGRS